MARESSLLYLGLAAPLILICFFVRGMGAELLFTALAMGFPVALIVLAVARDGRLGPLRAPLTLLLLLLEGSAVAMLVLRGRVLDGPWVGGLPAATAVLLYGLWLAPLPIVGLAYALTFDHFDIRDEDLRRFESRSGGSGDGG